ncbi:MAG: ribosome silencing factor [Candidatus Eisenbacteria bacterium]|nr:ribosome silencing factor [Candidatus Latescibacterota bacterium]MBD3302786.1 ribosome silencing factor [Candidatus Eisenbacteria bacterium]
MTGGSRHQPESKDLALRIARLALEKKAEDVLLLDLTGVSAACDYFVVCTGTSEQQVAGIADHIETKMKEEDSPVWHVEGRSHRRWILLDFVDVVAHVFHHETRRYYLLERLWGDAEVTKIEDEAQKRGVKG